MYPMNEIPQSVRYTARTFTQHQLFIVGIFVELGHAADLMSIAILCPQLPDTDLKVDVPNVRAIRSTSQFVDSFL